MIPVVLESPFAGETEEEVLRNLRYAREATRDAICNYLEAPFTAHLLYTQAGILDDKVWSERTTGILAAQEWYRYAKRIVVYADYGITPGMQEGIQVGRSFKLPIVLRKLDALP